MTRHFKIIVAAIALLAATPAFAQSGCGGQFGANKVCGNATGSTGLPGPVSITPGMFGAIAGGTVVGNPTTSNAVPIATTAPVLGIPGTSTGQVGLAGSGSGTSILRAQTSAGSAVSLLPTAAGTLVGTAVAPLAINATTGEASITGLAGAILYGTPPAFSRTPVLGVPGSAIGTLGFGGNVGGTATITPQATAGSPTLTLPNTSGTFAVGASLPLVLSATTGNLTCPTCATSTLNGAALTKVDDTNVTLTLGGSPTTALLNATSITAGWAGQLGLTRGGTGASLTASNGGLVYSTGAALAIRSGTATANQIPLSGANAAPSWSTATYPGTAAAGTVLNAGAANVLSATAQPVLGANGGTGGQFTLNGSTSGSAVLRVGAAAGTGTIFQLPPDNGTNTYVLQTNGAGATSWVASAGGGTVTSVGFTGGLISVATPTTTPAFTVAGTSGGVPYFSSTSTWASSALLATNSLMVGGGAGGAPSTVTTNATVLTAIGSAPTGTGSIVLSNSPAFTGTPTGLVRSIAGNTGAFTLSTGLTNSTNAILIDKATSANLEAGASNKVLTADNIYDGEVTITYAASQTLDFNTFLNGRVTLTGNITSLTCSNIKASQSGTITLVQDGTGSRTMVAGWCSQFRWTAGTRGVLSTAINAVDALFYQCVTTSICYVSLGKAMAN